MLGVSRKYSSHFRMYETFSRQSMITMDQSATVGDMRRHRSYGFKTASFCGMDNVHTWYGHLVWTSMDMVWTR